MSVVAEIVREREGLPSFSRPALTKYVQRHHIAQRREGRATLVHVGDLLAHRAASAGRIANAKGRSVEAAPAPAPVASSPGGYDPAFDPTLRLKTAQATMAEAKVFERMGQLVPAAEVQAAAIEAVAVLAEAGRHAEAPFADRLAAALGLGADAKPAIREVFRGAVKDIRATFAARLDARLPHPASDPAASSAAA